MIDATPLTPPSAWAELHFQYKPYHMDNSFWQMWSEIKNLWNHALFFIVTLILFLMHFLLPFWWTLYAITNVWRVPIDTLILYRVNTTLVFTYVVLNCVSNEGLLTIIYNGAVLDRPCLSYTKAMFTLGNYRFTYNGAVYWTLIKRPVEDGNIILKY